MKKIAFLDEYGDPSLKIHEKGVTTNYIVAAVVINENEIDVLREKATEVSNEYFSGVELKSSSIGKNHKRRISVLKRLISKVHKIHILSVDKSKLLKTGGLIYRRPFVKYIQSILHKRLCIANPTLDIITDEHGRNEFMTGFIRYVNKKNYQSDLFSELNFLFRDSTKERGIQVADIYAGSVARVFDPKKFTEKAKEILEIIRPNILSMEHWPPRMRGYVESPKVKDKTQEKIRIASQRVALAYLEDNYDSARGIIRARCETLNYLLYKIRNSISSEFTPTHEIIEVINEITGQDLSDQEFRASIIGPLRDSNILIISNSQGYKIAENFEELHTFVYEVDRRVKPQLNRVANFRESVLSTTNGKTDIFEGHAGYLKTAIQSIKEST